MVLGILWSSIKQIEAPYIFGWVHGIALHGKQGKWASCSGEGEVSWVFSSCNRNLEYIPELRREWPFQTRVCSATSALLSSYNGHLRNLNNAWQDITDITKRPFLVGTVILGFKSIFKKSQASSPFEALNWARLWRCQGMTGPVS